MLEQGKTYQEESANTAQAQVNVDPDTIERYRQELRAEQNLSLAIIGAGVISLVCAALWAAITVTTEYQIGYMALAVGAAVGYAVRILGKGVDPVFGVIGAIFSFLGCAAGNLLAICYFVSVQESVGFMQVLQSVNIPIAADVLYHSADFTDMIFYGLAIYEGYFFAFQRFQEEGFATPAAQ